MSRHRHAPRVNTFNWDDGFRSSDVQVYKFNGGEPPQLARETRKVSWKLRCTLVLTRAPEKLQVVIFLNRGEVRVLQRKTCGNHPLCTSRVRPVREENEEGSS